MKTLFFFLLVTQICFGQWVPLGLYGNNIMDIAVKDSIIFTVTSDTCYLNGQGITCCGKVFRSTNNGSNWSIIVDSGVLDITISPTGKIFMIKGGSAPYGWGDSLYSSIDNGDTWLTSNIMEQLVGLIPEGMPQNLAISPDGIIFCGIHWGGFGTGDALAKSTDDGITWTTPGEGIISGKLYDFRDQFVVTVGEFRCVSTCPFWWDMYISSDYGDTWGHLEVCYVSDDPNFVALFSNGNIVIDDDTLGWSSPKGIFLSTDTCSTWAKISSLDCQVGLKWSSGFSEGMLIGTDSLGVFLFSDDGDSLGAWNDGLILSLDIRALTADNNGFVYAGLGSNMLLGSGGVWRRPLSEIIPVELTSFTAISNGNEVMLNWSTATETNNQGFEIERRQKSNVKSQTEWKKIGFISGFGTTTEPKTYSYTDSKVSTGKYTYRLKQIDFDGSFEYSREVEVEVSAPLEFALVQNYPNPFNSATAIKYSIPNRSNVTLKIYDILGNEVATLVNEEKEQGVHTINFDANNLASGLYLYRILAGSFIETKKMILLK